LGKEILREDKGYISTLLFNRPEKRNALNADALLLMGDLVEKIEEEKKSRVIILRGSNEKIFSSGVDLSEGEKSFVKTIKALEYCLDKLINCPIPIISMIYGHAIGAGLDISTISDFRIVEKKAKFGAPLVKLGRTYYFTAIERLTRLIGQAAANEVLLTGKLMDSQWAYKSGLAHQVVSHEELKEVTYALADEIASAAPLALKATKITIKKLSEPRPLSPDVEKYLQNIVDEVNKSQDAKEGVRAMLEKRKPSFIGA